MKRTLMKNIRLTKPVSELTDRQLIELYISPHVKINSHLFYVLQKERNKRGDIFK